MNAGTSDNRGGERGEAVFRDSVHRAFAFLKRTERLDELFAKSIPLDGDRGWLVPVSYLHADDESFIALLSDWRRAKESTFPTRFTVTPEGTARWLRTQVLENAARMLFVVTDRHGALLGHVGLVMAGEDARVLELDNILRGVAKTEPGIMSDAMRALMLWGNETLWPDGFSLRVLASNERAIDFYRKLGFVESGREPLVWVANDDSSRLEPWDSESGSACDDSFVSMVYSPAARVRFPEMILTAGPSISGREIAYVLDAVRCGWNRHWSDYLDRFEQALAEFIGVEHVLATSSCTGALHIALSALDIGPGDEVIVPDVTWVATANAVRYVGATPVFADVQPDTMCIDPEDVRARITPRTKAVIAVHLYGHPADMQAILEIARTAGLRVIEDAAPSIGAECRGARTGTFGDFGAFSFQGAKLLVTGEGGALVTNDAELYQRARKIWDQGRDPTRTFWIDAQGLKYKMSNVQAAVGLGQVERAEEHVEAKRRLHARYREALAGIPGMSLCEEASWARSVHWMNTILTEDKTGVQRDELVAWLHANNVDSRPVFPAISDYPIWPGQDSGGRVARSIAARGLNLPSGLWMQRDHVTYVGHCLRRFFDRADHRA